MKQEEIEKVAGDYSGSALGFKDNIRAIVIHNAFADGAKWRINSVWHDAEEAAETGSLIFIHSRQRCVSMVRFYGEWKEMVRKYVIKQWAYMSDLLPTEE